jgi:hypothetical protein
MAGAGSLRFDKALRKARCRIEVILSRTPLTKLLLKALRRRDNLAALGS